MSDRDHHHRHLFFDDEKNEQHRKDAQQLKKFGYEQELHRSLSFLSSWALAFSWISATTGIYVIFFYGLGTGGPAFIWSWPMVFFGQLLVALTFAEIASHYPIAGGIYQWCKHLVGGAYAWFSGWMLLVALIVTIGAVDIGAAPVVSSLLGLESTRGVVTIIALGFIVAQTLLNITGVRVMSFVTNIGTFTEIVGILGVGALLLGAIFFGKQPHQGVSVLFDTGGTGHGMAYLGGAFLAAMLTATWTMYGFDSAGGMAEETVNPTKEVPKAILGSHIATFLVGGFFMFAIIIAIPDVKTAMGKGVDVIPYILNSHFPAWMTDVLLLIVSVAMFVCGLAIQGTAARLLFSYGRDGEIPAAGFFRKISPRFATPVRSLLFTTVLIMILVAAQSQLARIIAWATVGIYITYLMVVLASMIARAKGWPREEAGFNLRGWGWPVSVAAICYQIFMIVNLAWPRTPDAAWYDNYLVPLSAVLAFGLGLIVYGYVRLRRPDAGTVSAVAELDLDEA